MSKPITPAQAETLRDVARGAGAPRGLGVRRTAGWLVLGARMDVLGRLEEAGLVKWSGPDDHGRARNRRDPFGPVVLTDAGRAALAELDRPEADPLAAFRGPDGVLGNDYRDGDEDRAAERAEAEAERDA